MADFYWFGGTGNWSDYANHWSDNSGNSPASPKGAVPGTGDNVICDSLSHNGNYTIGVDAAANCADFTAAAPSSGNLTLGSSAILNVYGSLTFYAGMLKTGSFAINFAATATGKTVTTAGVSTGSGGFAFNGVNGGWTLQDNLTVTGPFVLTNGALDLNGKTVTCAQFASNNTNTRSLTTGAATIICTTTIGNAVVIDKTNLTYDFTGSTIKLTGNGSMTFAGGGITYGNVWRAGGASTGTLTISGANTFVDFKDDGTAAHTIKWPNNTTSTLTTFTVSGHAGALISLTSGTAGTASTLSCGSGTINCDYLNIKDSVAQGGATWNAGAHSVDSGGNSGWIFPSTGARRSLMGVGM